MPVHFYQTTRRNNLEDSYLHTRRCENLKSYYDHPAIHHLMLMTAIGKCLATVSSAIVSNTDGISVVIWLIDVTQL
jgi:hypothetical protein